MAARACEHRPHPAPPAPSANRSELLSDGHHRIPSEQLRAYLLRLRVEPRSREARERRNLSRFGVGDGEENSEIVSGPEDFQTWGRRVRSEKAEQAREQKR